jgi:hypothetical protein
VYPIGARLDRSQKYFPFSRGSLETTDCVGAFRFPKSSVVSKIVVAVQVQLSVNYGDILPAVGRCCPLTTTSLTFLKLAGQQHLVKMQSIRYLNTLNVTRMSSSQTLLQCFFICLTSLWRAAWMVSSLSLRKKVASDELPGDEYDDRGSKLKFKTSGKLCS